MRFLLVLSIPVLLAVAAQGGHHEGPDYDPAKTFAEADSNADGKIDRAEYHERMVEIFFHGDRDKDGYMTWEELQKFVRFPDDYRGADRDKDGRISMYEFIRVRFDDYDLVDTDDDGVLSLAEVTAVFQRGGVR